MTPDRLEAELDVVAVLSRVARSLSPRADVDELLASITQAALDVIPGADCASITMSSSDGTAAVLASTDDTAGEAATVEHESGEGPCFAAVSLEQTAWSGDMTTESRWPRYAGRAAALGIGSQLAVQIFRAGSSYAVVNVYSKTVGAFSESQQVAELFGSQASIAMSFVQTAQTLERALVSRKVIGQAIGMVMERHGLDEDRAFAYLVRTSQDNNMKLRVVAQEIVDLHNQRAATRSR